MTSDLRKYATTGLPWALLGVVFVIAFVFGTCVAAPEPQPETITDDGEETVWTCSMHPQVRASEPGQCPICGMDLIPAGSLSDQSAERVTMSERAAALARIRTATVEPLGGAGAGRQLLGRVEYDESSLATVTAWVGGRIDRLRLSVTGESVRRGQVVAALFSPEVYAAHQDLLSARQQQQRLARGTETARRAADAALEAARTRLRLLGVPDRELERMEEATSPWRQIPIRSPFSGTVIERVATEGTYVTTGAPLYRLADLSTVWVQLDAYESDLPMLAVGQEVTLEVEGLPGRLIDGQVAFVDPVVDPRTRTAKVRVEVDNEEGTLRPGMFAQAVVAADIQAGGEAPLTIPDTAPLFTGRRSLVYVEIVDDGRPSYEPRQVRLGAHLGERYVVLAGLEEGERVVVEGAFAIDADLQIRGGPSMMTRADDGSATGEALAASPRFRADFGTVLEAYLAIQEGLAGDALDVAKTAADRLRQRLVEVGPPGTEDAASLWTDVAPTLSSGAEAVETAQDPAAARAAFVELSVATLRALRAFGNPTDATVRIAYCPMADDGTGAEWAQRAEAVSNPYFGAAMDTCGEIRETFEPTAGEEDEGPQRPRPRRDPGASMTAAMQPVSMQTPTTEEPAPTPTMTSVFWTCPMHPQIRRSGPGQCPICGMDLVRRQSADDHAGHVH